MHLFVNRAAAGLSSQDLCLSSPVRSGAFLVPWFLKMVSSRCPFKARAFVVTNMVQAHAQPLQCTTLRSFSLHPPTTHAHEHIQYIVTCIRTPLPPSPPPPHTKLHMVQFLFPGGRRQPSVQCPMRWHGTHRQSRACKGSNRSTAL